jgi:hypothetical protein
MEEIPIAAYPTDLKSRVRSTMPLGNPDRVALLPVNKTLASPGEIPLSGEHLSLEIIDSGWLQ